MAGIQRKSLHIRMSLKIHIIRIPNYIYTSNIAANTKTLFKMNRSVFYHAGCPVCISAEQDIVTLIGNDKVEVVHLGEQKNRIAEAEALGIKSVPALFTPNGHVLHINFGASLEDVKG